MKNVGLLFITLLLVSATTFAQKFNYGHLNGEVVFKEMEQVKKADEQLKTFVSTLEEQAKSMQEEYAKKVASFNEKKETMSESVKAIQIDQINNLNESIQKFQVSAQKDIAKKRDELYSPIIKVFQAALKKVAKANGYRFIIDNSKGVFLYYEDTDDVTKLVEKELGIVKK